MDKVTVSRAAPALGERGLAAKVARRPRPQVPPAGLDARGRPAARRGRPRGPGRGEASAGRPDQGGGRHPRSLADPGRNRRPRPARGWSEVVSFDTIRLSQERPMVDNPENPLGIDGFEFVEFQPVPSPSAWPRSWSGWGSPPSTAIPRDVDVVHYRQGGINMLLNRSAEGQAAAFRTAHGPSANGMAFRVDNAARAYDMALVRGAAPDGRTSASALGDERLRAAGYRRLAALSGGPLRCAGVDLRHLDADPRRGRGGGQERRGPLSAGPPNPQRAPRRDADLVELLRPRVRLHRAEVFRHQGPGDGPVPARTR